MSLVGELKSKQLLCCDKFDRLPFFSLNVKWIELVPHTETDMLPICSVLTNSVLAVPL